MASVSTTSCGVSPSASRRCARRTSTTRSQQGWVGTQRGSTARLPLPWDLACDTVAASPDEPSRRSKRSHRSVEALSPPPHPASAYTSTPSAHHLPTASRVTCPTSPCIDQDGPLTISMIDVGTDLDELAIAERDVAIHGLASTDLAIG